MVSISVRALIDGIQRLLRVSLNVMVLETCGVGEFTVTDWTEKSLRRSSRRARRASQATYFFIEGTDRCGITVVTIGIE